MICSVLNLETNAVDSLLSCAVVSAAISVVSIATNWSLPKALRASVEMALICVLDSAAIASVASLPA